MGTRALLSCCPLSPIACSHRWSGKFWSNKIMNEQKIQIGTYTNVYVSSNGHRPARDNGRESFSCTDSFVVNLSQRRSKSRILSLSLSRKRRSWLQRPAATHALRPLVAVYRQLHDADSLSWCVRAKTVDKIAYDLSSAFRTRTLGTLPPLGFRCRSCFRFFSGPWFQKADYRSNGQVMLF